MGQSGRTAANKDGETKRYRRTAKTEAHIRAADAPPILNKSMDAWVNDIKIILNIIVVVKVTVSAILVIVVMVIMQKRSGNGGNGAKRRALRLSYHSEDLPEAKIQ